MAKWIKANGEVCDVTPRNGKDFSLDELQAFVHGYIELVYLGNDMVMVVNEEGKLLGLPRNTKATQMYPLDIIVGDVLVCHSNQID